MSSPAAARVNCAFSLDAMDLPVNSFKRAIAAGRQQIGLWVSLASAYSIEVVAGAGFDWLVIDTEHSPNEVDTTLAQLQVVAGYPLVSAVVRPAWNDTVLIKRHLDVGARSVDRAREAEAAQVVEEPGREQRRAAPIDEGRQIRDVVVRKRQPAQVRQRRRDARRDRVATPERRSPEGQVKDRLAIRCSGLPVAASHGELIQVSEQRQRATAGLRAGETCAGEAEAHSPTRRAGS